MTRTKWLIIVGGGLVAAAVVFYLIWSSQRFEARKLDLDRLGKARDLWSQKGPKNYRLIYYVTTSAGATPDRVEATIENGQAVSVRYNKDKDERLAHYGMDRLFEDIARLLLKDHTDELRNKDRDRSRALHLADFDSADGHLLLYQRRLSSANEYVEIRVESLEPY